MSQLPPQIFDPHQNACYESCSWLQMLSSIAWAYERVILPVSVRVVETWPCFIEGNRHMCCPTLSREDRADASFLNFQDTLHCIEPCLH